MESIKKRTVKNFCKKIWKIIQPYLLAIIVVASIITAVVLLTYLYFTCTQGSIPADRIIDENAIKKSDWLAFWGSILAVICTLSLALVSYRQNKDLHKLNDDREKKDAFFAKLRFAAEFYSLIELTSIRIKEDDNKTVEFIFDIRDAGKMPPNRINFSKIELKPSDLIYQISTPISNQMLVLQISNVETDIKSTPMVISGGGENHWRTININIGIDQYENLKRMFAEIYELGRRYQELNIWGKPVFKLVLEYTLENPLDVKTNVVSEFLLKTDFSSYTPNEERSFYRFTIKEKLDLKITYDFTRKIM